MATNTYMTFSCSSLHLLAPHSCTITQLCKDSIKRRGKCMHCFNGNSWSVRCPSSRCPHQPPQRHLQPSSSSSAAASAAVERPQRRWQQQQQQHQICAASIYKRVRKPSALSAAADGMQPSAGDGGAHDPGAWLQQVQRFIKAQYLPVALIGALLLGAVNPAPGLAAAKMRIPALATFGIFLVQGLQLRKAEAMSALSLTGPIAYGLASILALTPLVGVLVARLPLQPQPLALGLGAICTMPTALACGVAFVQQVGGNASLALLLTLVSNITGVFTMPFFLPHVVSASSAAASGSSGGGYAASSSMIDPIALMMQLCQTILLPTLLGASIRGFVPGAAAAIDKRKRTLSYINAAMLASVPWMQISKTASHNMAVDLPGLVIAAAAALGVHILLVALNTGACRVFRLGGSDAAAATDIRRCIIIVASVKTLPVAVTVLSNLDCVLGEHVVGVAMLSVVFYQLAQIIWGSLMVSQWLHQDSATGGQVE